MRGPFRAAIAMLAGVAGLAVAAPALAATNTPIAQTGGAEATFMIAGVPLNVNVVLDTTTGDITSVSVDPGAGLTAVADSPTKVKFETADGTTKVSVKAKKNSLSMGVRTDSLAKLVGANKWSGDLFGTGTKTTVNYTIGDDGSGAPTFAFDSPPAPADGSTATVLGTWNGSAGHDDDDSDSAGGRVAFDLKGFRKTLTIAVFVSHETDDGNASGTASLRVTLQGRDIQKLPLADLVGPHSWAGVLCEGTKASIDYTVNADGSLTVTGTTPADSTNNPSRHGVLVKFATGDKVLIQLFTPTSGDASLKVDRKGRQCTGTRVTAADPTVVGAPVSTTAPSDRKHGDDKGGKHGKGGTTSTTAAGGTTTTGSTVAANANRTGGHGGNNGSDD